MPGPPECDSRRWQIFWSTVNEAGTRFRHRVRQLGSRECKTETWVVRTEMRLRGQFRMSYSASTVVPPEHGRAMYDMSFQWTNINESDNPHYPPEYPKGFTELEVNIGPVTSDKP